MCRGDENPVRRKWFFVKQRLIPVFCITSILQGILHDQITKARHHAPWAPGFLFLGMLIERKMALTLCNTDHLKIPLLIGPPAGALINIDQVYRG